MISLCRRLVCVLFLIGCSTAVIAQEATPPPKFQIPATETLCATIEALPEIVAEVGNRVPVFVDVAFAEVPMRSRP